MRRVAVVGSEKRLTRCFLVFEVASKSNEKLAKTLFFFILCKGAQHNDCTTDEEMVFTRRVLFSRRRICLLGSRRRRCCWAQTYVPIMGSKLLGPNKC